MIHHFQPTHYHNTLGSHPPVLRVKDGDTIITTTIDAGGRDAQGNQVNEGGNPQTGPFYVEGAAPGDTLAVHIERIEPNRPRGYGRATVSRNVVDPDYVPELPEQAREEWQVDWPQRTATLLAPDTGLDGWKVRLAPMLGCFGVAPRRGQAISTSTSGEHGGNMDYRGFAVGAIAYFPVFVEGALFSLGDGHAQQADGEITRTGIEISMNVQVTLRVLKGKTINWPRGEDADFIFTVGNARPLDQALQHATTEMLRWLQQDYGMDALAANIFLGHSVFYEVGNVIDPAYTMVCKVPKALLSAR